MISRLRHLLVTTDLSHQAERAFAPAAELARVLGARLTLLHVRQVLTAPPVAPQPVPASYSPEELAEVDEALALQADELGGGLEVEHLVLVDRDVAHAIASFAAENDVDLIALSSHGRSGLERWVMGSVAEGVLRRSTVPVLCFPPPAPAPAEELARVADLALGT